MQKATPSLPRVLIMVSFALSCFGLLLFLWLSFGGPIPLKAKGYRFKVAFPEAAQLGLEADVRVEVLLAHLAHRHPGHPDVGLQAQLDGLGEGDFEAIALGLERDRTAERQPQEQQQPEARQREQHHREDATE